MKAKIPELVGIKQAAAILGVAPRTLDKWRGERRGPKFVRQDGRVLYPSDDIVRYIDAHTIVPGWTEETAEAVALAQSSPGDTRNLVYFIRTDDWKFLKIGTTFGSKPRHAETRMSLLQCGCPLKLHLVAVVRGGVPVERQFHKIFDAYRVQREWFRLEPAIRRFLEHLNERRKSA